MPPSFSLLSLPEEMIEHICQQLLGHPESKYDPKSLSHLCRTSKDVNRIGTPVLYSCFDAHERLKRTADFLRTISLRPDLGQLVQDLYFSTFYWFKLSQSHIEVFTGAAARLGVSLDGWFEDYPYEAMVQLIIAQTPNVRAIDVSAHEVCSDDGVGSFTLLEKMASQVPRRVSLPHLRRLCVGHDDSRRISLGYFEGIFGLAPNVRQLTMDPCYGLHCDERHVNDCMVLDNVTSLQLNGGHLSKHQLESIVSRCRALETFKYKYYSIYAGLKEVCVTPREVIEMLRQHNHNDTLHSIHLNLGWRERRLPDDITFSGTCADGDQILSLKDFSRLETFYVDGSSVLFPTVQTPGYRTNILTNMLPSSICHFLLTNAQKESVVNVMSLADSIADFPLLEEIVLTGNSMGGPLGDEEVVLDDSEINMLCKILDENGVRFKDTHDDDV